MQQRYRRIKSILQLHVNEKKFTENAAGWDGVGWDDVVRVVSTAHSKDKLTSSFFTLIKSIEFKK